MGCENCINNQKEPEINNNKILITDLENQQYQELLNSDEKTNTGNNKNTQKLNITTKDLINFKKNQFNFEVLNNINIYRLLHGVGELTIDENINKISQKYAEKLARESELELSGNQFNGEELGEIIFTYPKEISPKELVDLWYYSESKDYNYKKEPEVSTNFTQLIWKKSKLFGIGHTLTKDNKLYIVANFYPMGNVKGQFLKNVFPQTTNNKNNDSSFYSITTKFLDEALFAHNELRAKHNSPPLVLNPILSTLAQDHSNFLAKEGKLINSNNKLKDQKIGENLFMSKYNCSGEEVTSFWYKGIKKYNATNLGNNKKNNEEINNFTQLIWKSTKEVGFGFSTDKKGNFYAVANYFPCGNIKGKYNKNVLLD